MMAVAVNTKKAGLTRNNRNTSERRILLVLKALLVMILICSIFSIRAIGNEKAYFSTATDAAEAEYMSELRNLLSDNGVHNAGITMTKTSVDGLHIEYEVLIHTSQIYKNLLAESNIMDEIDGVKMEVEYSNTTVIFQ